LRAYTQRVPQALIVDAQPGFATRSAPACGPLLLALALYENFEHLNDIAGSRPQAICDPIDFNNNSLFPEDQDLIDLLSVLAGGPCSNDPPVAAGCNFIDFNNDGLFPSDDDLIAYLRVFAGGDC
jgi:hypothetical protein